MAQKCRAPLLKSIHKNICIMRCMTPWSHAAMLTIDASKLLLLGAGSCMSRCGWFAHDVCKWHDLCVSDCRWYELVLAAEDDIATIMTMEGGKPLKESKGEFASGYISVS